MIKSNKKIYLVHNLILLLVFIAIVKASVLEGRFRVDPHHWGIMLSSAKDLIDGKLPYRDIYNIYGILTTVVHAIGFKYLGGNMISIIEVTALFYVVGLWLLFKITLRTTEDIKLAWFVLIACILIHPVVIYPWSNYIAFPFLMGGIYYLVFNIKAKNVICSGFLFSLAILSREGVLIPVILIVFTFLMTDYVIKKIKIREILKQCLFIVIGASVPIGVFILYLVKNDITKYWVILSVLLPKIYAQGQFPHMSTLKFLNPFLLELKNGLINFDVYWIAILLMLVCTILGLMYTAFNFKKYDGQRIKIVKLSFASLVLLITTLHIPEIFRISTGSIVGMIVLFYWLKIVRLDMVGFVIICGILIFNVTKISSGNPFYPDSHIRSQAKYISSPNLLKGQLWPIDIQGYYINFQNNMNEINKLKCNIKYHYNETMDTMLYALSPFERYQLTPYLHSLFDFLRPDLNYQKMISEAEEIIIFKIVAGEDIDTFKVPEGFVLYKKLKPSPTQWVYKKGDNLIILVPTKCIE